MRKLTSCAGYVKRMAARMQFNAVKDQLNMVLVALAVMRRWMYQTAPAAGAMSPISRSRQRQTSSQSKSTLF